MYEYKSNHKIQNPRRTSHSPMLFTPHSSSCQHFKNYFIIISFQQISKSSILFVLTMNYSVATMALFLIVPFCSTQQQQMLDRPKSNFRFPSKLRIINNNDDAVTVNNNGLVAHHFPNPMAPGNSYGIPTAPVVDCVCPCTKEYLPICGTDFKTYGNNCLFQCQRRCNPALQFKSCGTCEEPIEDLQIPCF